MKDIKLIHTGGPYGDCMSSYDINFPKDITVDNFIIAVLKDYPKEWGEFYHSYEKSFAKYKNGKLFITDYKEYQNIQNKIVLSASSHGGWSLMDYFIQC